MNDLQAHFEKKYLRDEPFKIHHVADHPHHQPLLCDRTGHPTGLLLHLFFTAGIVYGRIRPIGPAWPGGQTLVLWYLPGHGNHRPVFSRFQRLVLGEHEQSPNPGTDHGAHIDVDTNDHAAGSPESSKRPWGNAHKIPIPSELSVYQGRSDKRP